MFSAKLIGFGKGWIFFVFGCWLFEAKSCYLWLFFESCFSVKWKMSIVYWNLSKYDILLFGVTNKKLVLVPSAGVRASEIFQSNATFFHAKSFFWFRVLGGHVIGLDLCWSNGAGEAVRGIWNFWGQDGPHLRSWWGLVAPVPIFWRLRSVCAILGTRSSSPFGERWFPRCLLWDGLSERCLFRGLKVRKNFWRKIRISVWRAVFRKIDRLR